MRRVLGTRGVRGGPATDRVGQGSKNLGPGGLPLLPALCSQEGCGLMPVLWCWSRR